MKFSIALTDLESMLRAVLPTRMRKADTVTIAACAARVFVASKATVAGMEALVLADGGVRIPAKAFCGVIKTYKGTRALVFEGSAAGLRVQNCHMPVLAYDPAPKPPGDFQVFRTSAAPAAAIPQPRMTSVADDGIVSEIVEAPLVPAREPVAAPVDLVALVREGKRIQGGEGMTSENTRALRLFHQAAMAGHTEAQYLISECYRLGCGVQRDEAQALAWLQKSADSGFMKACMRLGIFYQRSVSKNDKEAIKWYQKAAETGCAGACVMLAGIYKEQGDLAGELKWNKEYALQGNPEALWEMRTFYERRDGVEVALPEAYAWLSLFEDSYTTRKNSEELVCFQLDPEISKYRTTSQDLTPLMAASQIDQGNRRYQDLVKQRVRWIRQKAEEGSRDEQYNLGWCYRDGYGVPQDRAESVRWWRMAGEQGERRAQNNLGHCYNNAEGVEQNHDEAVRWFRKAAEQGYAKAQYHFGILYEIGIGVEKDRAQAATWYRKAAEQGHAGAQGKLGTMYALGEEVPQSYTEAANWYRKAAEQGDVHGQERLGRCYLDGHGVPQDIRHAYKWFRLAAEQGHASAKQDMTELAALMSPAEFAAAYELYQEFTDKYLE